MEEEDEQDTASSDGNNSTGAIGMAPAASAASRNYRADSRATLGASAPLGDRDVEKAAASPSTSTSSSKSTQESSTSSSKSTQESSSESPRAGPFSNHAANKQDRAPCAGVDKPAERNELDKENEVGPGPCAPPGANLAGTASSSERRTRGRRMKRSRSTSSSRYRGVSWFRANQVWKAQITVNGKYEYLGYYTSEEAAAWEYDLRAVQVHGRAAQLNFPDRLVELTNEVAARERAGLNRSGRAARMRAAAESAQALLDARSGAPQQPAPAPSTASPHRASLTQALDAAAALRKSNVVLVRQNMGETHAVAEELPPLPSQRMMWHNSLHGGRLEQAASGHFWRERRAAAFLSPLLQSGQVDMGLVRELVAFRTQLDAAHMFPSRALPLDPFGEAIASASDVAVAVATCSALELAGPDQAGAQRDAARVLVQASGLGLSEISRAVEAPEWVLLAWLEGAPVPPHYDNLASRCLRVLGAWHSREEGWRERVLRDSAALLLDHLRITAGEVLAATGLEPGALLQLLSPSASINCEHLRVILLYLQVRLRDAGLMRVAWILLQAAHDLLE